MVIYRMSKQIIIGGVVLSGVADSPFCYLQKQSVVQMLVQKSKTKIANL